MPNYRIWKEIGVCGAWQGEYERQITPVENAASFHVEQTPGKRPQAALFHVEQCHYRARRPMARII